MERTMRYNKEKKEETALAPFHFHTRVSYADIDESFHLTMPAAMRMMQEAAILDSDRAGYAIRDIQRTRVIWMLVQWHVRMLGTAGWDENLTVTTWPRSMDKVTSNRCFRMTDSQGQTIAVAETDWLLVNVDTGRAMRIPPEVAQAYELVDEGVFDTPMPALSKEIGELTYTGTVLHRDIDTNHHVNNLVYLSYAREAMPPADADRDFREVVVRYHRQLLRGDRIQCCYQRTPQGHQVQICKDDPSHVHCTVLFLD